MIHRSIGEKLKIDEIRRKLKIFTYLLNTKRHYKCEGETNDKSLEEETLPHDDGERSLKSIIFVKGSLSKSPVWQYTYLGLVFPMLVNIFLARDFIGKFNRSIIIMS